MLIVIDVQYLFNEFYFKDHQRVESQIDSSFKYLPQ